MKKIDSEPEGGEFRGRLTEQDIENLAVEIREFLLEHEMWIDVNIYFNDKCFTTHDKNTGKFYYNDREHFVVRENENPRMYFEYVNPDHILSMSFEGTVCEMLYYGMYPSIKNKFDAIFSRYGLYYEFGNHWNFSCYYI